MKIITHGEPYVFECEYGFLENNIMEFVCLEIRMICRDWRGSVDWVLSQEKKGHPFNS